MNPPQGETLRVKRPTWGDNPRFWVAFSLGGAASFAAFLSYYWVIGRWTPSLVDLMAALGGIVLSAACIIPDYCWLRREGDAYVANLHPRRLWRPVFWLCWIVALSGVSILDLWIPHCSGLSYQVGCCLGMLAWYPYMRTVWKRMWELYEQDQSATSPVAVGVAPDK